jgi:tetratricopeptide (TPR) repeat protein
VRLILTLLFTLLLSSATVAGILTNEKREEIEKSKKKAIELFTLGEYEKALPLLEKVLELNPEDKTAMRYKLIFHRQVIEPYCKEAADSYFAGNYPDAITAWEKILKISPNDRRVSSLINETITVTNDDAIKTLYSNVNKLLTGGQIELAMAEIEKILLINPVDERAQEMLSSTKRLVSSNIVRAYYEKAYVHMQQNEYDQAIEEWKTVLEIDPTQEKAARLISSAQEKKHEDFYSHVNSLLKKGQYDEATEELEKMLVISPNEVRTIEMLESIKRAKIDNTIKEHYERADKLAKEKKYDLAIEEWNTVLEIDPTQEKAAQLISSAQEKKHEDFYSHVNSLLKKGQYDEATEELEKMLIISPNEVRAIEMLESIKRAKIDNTIKEHYERADKLAKEKKYDLAIEEWNTVLEIDPNQDMASRMIASVHRKKLDEMYSSAAKLYKNGDYIKSRDIYNRILAVNPTDQKTKNMVGRINEIIKVVPQLPDKGKVWDVLRKGLAHHISNKGNPKVTIASAWLAVQLEPDNTLVLTIRDFIESKHISIIRTMEPPVEDMNMIEQYLFASLNHIYEGRYDLSIQECSIVLELEPKNVLALKRLGSAYFAMGRKSKARQSWKKALKLAPRDSELKEFIRQTR